VTVFDRLSLFDQKKEKKNIGVNLSAAVSGPKIAKMSTKIILN
jgi:hypothetical protein